MLILECTHRKCPEVLGKVFGVSWFAFAVETQPTMKAIEKPVLALAKKIGREQTFAVRASRSDKTLAVHQQGRREQDGRQDKEEGRPFEARRHAFHRVQKGQGLCLFGKDKGRGRASIRRYGQGPVAHFRRHRFARRELAHDETRLLGRFRSLQRRGKRCRETQRPGEETRRICAREARASRSAFRDLSRRRL